MATNKLSSVVLKFTILTFLLSLLTATGSFAEGRAIIKPNIEVGWQRDSNFHKSETNTKTVDTYFVKPGIVLGYTTDKSLISMDYWFNVIEYDDKDNNLAGELKASDFDYTEHQANFTAQTQASDRLLIGVDNFFMLTQDPANSDANSNAVDRFEYRINQFSPRLTYNFADKFGVGLAYTNLITDYTETGKGEDSDENRGTLTLFYYFSESLSFDLDYQYWQRDYDAATSDYDSNQVMINLNQQFNYFTFSAGVGYHTRNFDQTTVTGDIDNFVWKLSVTGQNPPDAVGIPRSYMYLALSSNLNDSGSGESYYTTTRLDAKVSHLFVEKINCTLTGWYQNSDYEATSREDDRWFFSAAADYIINDFFSVGIEGGLEDRNSNLTGKDFDNEFVMINAKFNYDFGSR